MAWSPQSGKNLNEILGLEKSGNLITGEKNQGILLGDTMVFPVDFCTTCLNYLNNYRK